MDPLIRRKTAQRPVATLISKRYEAEKEEKSGIIFGKKYMTA
jgi:hypothetical protein